MRLRPTLRLAATRRSGLGGGESRPGGLAVGGEASVKAKHKINVKQAVMADGKLQVTATIDDEGELGGALSTGLGAASMKVGKSYTEGQGRTIVFILDPSPKNPAFESQIAAINGAVTPEDIDRIATQNHGLVASKTDKKVEGEGTSVGATVIRCRSTWAARASSPQRSCVTRRAK